MEHRIGRTGVWVLAATCAAIALFGLVVLYQGLPAGAGTVTSLGIAVVALAVVGLTTLAFAITIPVKPKVQAEPVDQAAEPLPEFEYEPEAAGATVDVVGAKVSPPLSKDPRQWPQRQAKAQGIEVRKDLAAKYTQEAPVVREILADGGAATQVVEHIPEVTAKVPSPQQLAAGTLPDGYTKGKCGKCATHLFAPTARPLRLRCPACSKTTLLR